MVGSTGERVLAATLPHVDTWNTWYDWYGNTAEGFGAKVREIDDACERAGRDPTTLERSACVLVRLGDSGERRTNRASRRSAARSTRSAPASARSRRPAPTS